MNITVNQLNYSLNEACNIQELLTHVLQQPLQGLAVAINQTIIPRSRWNEHMLASGDDVMVITATQGG